jgi:hypothetical protein
MSEILFLTKYGHLSNTVVYAGAAPGNHIPYLATLFPTHKFILWDPAKFAIKEQKMIEIHTGYFTDDIAQQLAREQPLFISDVRSGNDDMSFSEFEAEVHKNNQMQARWIELIKPKMSMLKFRVPYGTPVSDCYEYLAGEVLVQPWAPQFSGETRLITDGSAKCVYVGYEHKMHWFNNVYRPHAKFLPLLSEIITVQGFTLSYDCMHEVYIWQLYADTFLARKAKKDVWIANSMNIVCKLLHRRFNNIAGARVRRLE